MATELRTRRAMDPLFRSLTASGRLHLCAGIFFTFASLGALLTLMRAGERDPWWATALWCCFSGGIAVGWALSFMWRRWLLAVVLPAQMALPPFLAVFVAGNRPWTFDGYRTAVGALTIALIVLGYVLFAWFLNNEGARRLRLQTEIELAQGIHRALAPPVQRRTRFAEVCGRSSASSEMGGDLLDVVEREDGLDLTVADVSGHGVRAGIVMGMVKSAMRARSGAGLAELLGSLNASLADLVEPGMFVTFACVRLRKGAAEYALAGHLPILVLEARTGRVRELENERLPLCIDTDEAYIERTAELAPGDVLALVTDGCTEAGDAQGRQFGIEGVKRVLEACVGRSTGEIHDAIEAAVRAHGRQIDDRTALIARVL